MPNTSVLFAAQLMLVHRISGLPVVEEDESVVGIITKSDLFQLLIAESAGADATDARRIMPLMQLIVEAPEAIYNGALG